MQISQLVKDYTSFIFENKYSKAIFWLRFDFQIESFKVIVGCWQKMATKAGFYENAYMSYDPDFDPAPETL